MNSSISTELAFGKLKDLIIPSLIDVCFLVCMESYS